MRDYIRYEIENRKYSSNVISGVYIYVDEKGKSHEKKDLIIGGFLEKKKSDKFIEKIHRELNDF
jgi:tRNA A22 N-methylase